MPDDYPSRLARAGLLTALSDGAFSSVLVALFYGASVTRLWQGVASYLLGPSALDGGTRTALVGVAMHVGVAFAWSAVFLLLHRALPALRDATATTAGALAVAAAYGPAVWLVMSLAVMPALSGRAPNVTYRWWVQLVGHIVFVAVPIVFSIARPRRAAAAYA